MTDLPKNPLAQILDAHRITRDAFSRATRGKIKPERLSVIRREIPTAPNQPAPQVPGAEALGVIHRAIKKLLPESVGLPPESWQPFIGALKARRAPHDRRRKAVRALEQPTVAA